MRSLFRCGGPGCRRSRSPTAHFAAHACFSNESRFIDPLTLAQLLQVAFVREKAAARRLSRSAGLSPLAALHQVLEQSAAPAGLTTLSAARLQALADDLQRRTDRRRAALDRFVRKQAGRVPDPASWHAWFDGSAAPNPGRLGIGAVLKGPDGSVRQISRAAGIGDGNAAEYLALIAVLEAAVALRVAHLIVHGDSQVVIQDLTEEVPVRTGALALSRRRAVALMRQIQSVVLVWIPRARNTHADALARRARSVVGSDPVDAEPVPEVKKQPALP